MGFSLLFPIGLTLSYPVCSCVCGIAVQSSESDINLVSNGALRNSGARAGLSIVPQIMSADLWCALQNDFARWHATQTKTGRHLFL
jgi:hypothetical protein